LLLRGLFKTTSTPCIAQNLSVGAAKFSDFHMGREITPGARISTDWHDLDSIARTEKAIGKRSWSSDGTCPRSHAAHLPQRDYTARLVIMRVCRPWLTAVIEYEAFGHEEERATQHAPGTAPVEKSGTPEIAHYFIGWGIARMAHLQLVG
jgi:hypothetical protein